MKTLKISILSLSIAALISSCGGSDAVEAGDKKEVAEATETSVVYNVDVNTSSVAWHGEKLAYGHDGTIKIKSGQLTMEGDKLTSGNFEIDMATIVETGEGIDPEKAKMLADHLMAPDFFDAAVYPTSKLEITTAEKGADGTYSISGNLTIKDSTKNIQFPATITTNETGLDANAEFTINRADWGVVYGTGLSGAVGDKVISNDIKFKVALKATK